MTVKRIVRQIDIAPTLLALLGFNSPAEWQGADALAASPPTRAYIFAGTGNFSFGLVEGDYKYIYDFQRDRADSTTWRRILAKPGIWLPTERTRP